MLVERIDDEQNGVELALDNQVGDLHVAPVWTALHAVDLQADLLAQHARGGACANQLAPLEAIPVVRGERNQIDLLAVVRDDRQPRRAILCAQVLLHGVSVSGMRGTSASVPA